MPSDSTTEGWVTTKNETRDYLDFFVRRKKDAFSIVDCIVFHLEKTKLYHWDFNFEVFSQESGCLFINQKDFSI